jgi:hypothetical protein
LEGVTAGDAILLGCGQAFAGEPTGSGRDLLGGLDLDTEVIEGTCHAPATCLTVFDQNQLEGWLGDGEIGIAGPAFSWLNPEELAVEVNGSVNVAHVQSKLHPTGHGIDLQR